MADFTTPPDILLSCVREEAVAARQREVAAAERLAIAVRAARFWNAVAERLNGGQWASALLVLQNDTRYAIAGSHSSEAVQSLVSALQAALEPLARERAAAFAREFPRAAHQAGIDLDRSSRYPQYTVRDGFLRVDVEPQRLTATFTPRDGTETLLGLDMDVVIGKVRDEQGRIFDRPEPGDAFRRRLYAQYVALLRDEGRQVGDEAPIRKLTSRLARRSHRFALDEFNVDLSRLIRSGRVVVDGRRLHVNHTRDTKKGMLLYQLEQGGYVGFISFKEEAPA